MMEVFPTHVGMNRLQGIEQGGAERIPHTRGDEPVNLYLCVNSGYSIPHTRGDEPK